MSLGETAEAGNGSLCKSGIHPPKLRSQRLKMEPMAGIDQIKPGTSLKIALFYGLVKHYPATIGSNDFTIFY